MKKVLFFAFLLFAGCSTGADSYTESDQMAFRNSSDVVSADEFQGAPPSSISSEYTKTPELAQDGTINPQRVSDPTPIQKRIVKQADLSFEVSNFEDAVKRAKEMVSESGGEISQENISQPDYRTQNTLTIRVDNDKFDLLVENLTELAVYISRKDISSEDITETFVDTEARLRTKKAVEERFVQILAQAKNITEILQVESQLSTVREEIEATQSRLNYLSNVSSRSTITLELYETSKTYIAPSNTFWYRFTSSFEEGWQGVTVLVLAITTLWPLWILIALVWFGVKRWKARKKSTEPQKESDSKTQDS